MKYLLISLLTLFSIIGCGSRGNDHIVVKKQPVAKPIPHTMKTLPPPPKKEIKLKEVEDSNYTDDYMYPEDTKAAKKDPTEKQAPAPVTNAGMTREECIAMISQEKFDKYTAMFGSEAASIKRCMMLKAMNE
jgi:hypothetical protein